MLSLSIMTCSIMWMAFCELWLGRQPSGRKIYTSLWSLRDKSCPNTMPKSLQRRVCFIFRHTYLILFASCNCLGKGTREWILILRTRLLILPNTQRHFGRMWKTNTARNSDDCRSLNMKNCRAMTSSILQRLPNLVNHLLIHMICPVVMKNTQRLKIWPKRHQDEVITQHAYWPPPGGIWIRRLNHQRAGEKLILISMITTSTRWRLAVHFGSRISRNGGDSKRKRIHSMPISPMWHAAYSQSYLIVLEWRPVFPLDKTLLAGGSPKPQAKPFGNRL